MKKDDGEKVCKKKTAGKVRKIKTKKSDSVTSKKVENARKKTEEKRNIRTDISDEEARKILEENCVEAEEILNNQEKKDDFLRRIERKMASVPLVGGVLASAPLMFAMLKGYASGEYTEVSKKSIILLISAFIYFINITDIIPDPIPVVGYVDDAIVFAVCISIIKKDLDRFKRWREQNEKKIQCNDNK